LERILVDRIQRGAGSQERQHVHDVSINPVGRVGNR
jgi:hypothetical protein